MKRLIFLIALPLLNLSGCATTNDYQQVATNTHYATIQNNFVRDGWNGYHWANVLEVDGKAVYSIWLQGAPKNPVRFAPGKHLLTIRAQYIKGFDDAPEKRMKMNVILKKDTQYHLETIAENDELKIWLADSHGLRCSEIVVDDVKHVSPLNNLPITIAAASMIVF